MKLQLTHLNFFMAFCMLFNSNIVLAQSKMLNGFSYTGVFFDDPDWGKSYNASETDRQLLSRTNKCIYDATARLLKTLGDYEIQITDMSFAFDPVKQEESRKNGSKCVTCYYSHNPATGEYFQYTVTIRLDLKEESSLFIKKAQRDDSIAQKVQSFTTVNSNAASEKQLQEEMNKLQKEIASVDYSKLTESQLAEIERKGKRLDQLAAGTSGVKTIPDDSLHAIYGDSYAQRIDISFKTNVPLTVTDKSGLIALKNNPAFFFQELNIPGCSFACIYFDKYNQNAALSHSDNYVFVAYIGKTYPNKASMPKDWVDPFCFKITFSGNLEQIKAISGQIDFTKLADILRTN